MPLIDDIIGIAARPRLLLAMPYYAHGKSCYWQAFLLVGGTAVDGGMDSRIFNAQS
jgi:hypothetical protein